MKPSQKASRNLVLVLFCALCSGSLTHAEDALLGEIDFPNSGAAEAQADFMEGVLYLHNFEYGSAAEAFRRAREIDPDFAMAYWGEAMTYNHPLWAQQARKEAVDVLRKLARTPEERQAKAGTEREKAYLHAVEVLYGTVEETQRLPKEARDDAYAEAMRRIHEQYPDDNEAATFYGLALLGTSHDGRDFATYMKAAAELMPVWDVNRKHPGAAHYLIHSFDDPVHAPLGLPMARAYSDIAPAAAHAQHMTSHIFVALGMWDDLIDANERACAVTDAERAAKEEPPAVSTHYTYWLLYGYLQQRRLDDAKALMDAAHKRVNGPSITSEDEYFALHRARYVIDSEDWAAAERYALPEDSPAFDHPVYRFTSAYAALQQGENVDVKSVIAGLRAGGGNIDTSVSESAVALYADQLQALALLRAGEAEKAVELLQEAELREGEMPYAFGPPSIVKPTAELLGEVLLAKGDTAEAQEAFRTQLGRTPGRQLAIEGLAASDTRMARE